MKNLKFKVKMPVLSSVVYVCVGDKDWREKFSKKMGLGDCGRTGACHYKEVPVGSAVCIVMMEYCVATFAHEAVHASGFIQRHMHRPPSWDDDELTAYIVGHLVDSYLTKVK